MCHSIEYKTNHNAKRKKNKEVERNLYSYSASHHSDSIGVLGVLEKFKIENANRQRDLWREIQKRLPYGFLLEAQLRNTRNHVL